MATPIARNTGSQNLAVPMITRSQKGTANWGRSMSGHGMDGQSMLGQGMDGSSMSGGRSVIQSSAGWQQKPYEHHKTEQPCPNLADGAHDVTGGVQPRMVSLEGQQPGRERPPRWVEEVPSHTDQSGSSGYALWQRERDVLVTPRLVWPVRIGVEIGRNQTRDKEQRSAHGPGQHTEHQHRRTQELTSGHIR